MIDSDPAQPQLKPIPSRTDEFPALWFFLAWFLLAIVATVPFWLSDLDIRVAAQYFDGGNATPWLRENDPLWRFFYHAAPVLVGILALSGLALAGAGLVDDRFLRLRPMGFYLLLTVILGPGLFVNALGKEYAGRPRPRQVTEFGGPLPYLVPFQLGKPGEGKSFPCGHCSVGFSFAALWLLVRRRNLWLGRLTLAGGLAMGMLMGVGRIAAGAHFFSDVLWSGLLTMLAAGLSYYYILRMPARWAAWEAGSAGTGAAAAAQSRQPGARLRGFLILGLAGGVLIFVLLLASPVHEDFSYTRPDAGEAPAMVILQVTSARTEVEITSGDAPAVHVVGKVRGFGLPSNKVKFAGNLKKVGNVPVITVQLRRMGLYTDYEGTLKIQLNHEKVSKLSIEQVDGELVLPELPLLEINTDKVRKGVRQKFEPLPEVEEAQPQVEVPSALVPQN